MKLTPEQREQLEVERSKGNLARNAYEAYIKSFVEAKRAVLFEAFRNLPLTAEDDLLEVKRMLFAIDQLELEITQEIQTGQMASEPVNKAEEAEQQETHH